MIVSLEDSPMMGSLLQRVLQPVLGDVKLSIYPTLMSAAADIPLASGVIIDWWLADKVSVIESGVLKLLRRKKIPHAIFTATPLKIPADIGCPVIDKSDVDALLVIVREWVQLAKEQEAQK